MGSTASAASTGISGSGLLSAFNCGQHSSSDELKALAKDLMRQQPVGLVIVSTKFMGPTDAQGSRVKAKINGTKASRTVGYAHEMHTVDAHAYAAVFLLSHWFEGEQLEYLGYDETADGKGFNFAYRFV